jgi:hypothetical protein
MNKEHALEWIASVAKPDVDPEATWLELANVLEDREAAGETPSYELGARFTQSGRPEIYYPE